MPFARTLACGPEEMGKMISLEAESRGALARALWFLPSDAETARDTVEAAIVRVDDTGAGVLHRGDDEEVAKIEGRRRVEFQGR